MHRTSNAQSNHLPALRAISRKLGWTSLRIQQHAVTVDDQNQHGLPPVITWFVAGQSDGKATDFFFRSMSIPSVRMQLTARLSMRCGLGSARDGIVFEYRRTMKQNWRGSNPGCIGVGLKRRLLGENIAESIPSAPLIHGSEFKKLGRLSQPL